MIQYSIEELHHLFSSGELDAKAYYDELFKEIDKILMERKNK